jgi:hypothetical protein
VPVPDWVESALWEWLQTAGITEGRIFRAVSRWGSVVGEKLSTTAVVALHPNRKITGARRFSGIQTVKWQILFYGLSAGSATSERAKERFPSSIWHPNRIRNWTQITFGFACHFLRFGCKRAGTHTV